MTDQVVLDVSMPVASRSSKDMVGGDGEGDGWGVRMSEGYLGMGSMCRCRVAWRGEWRKEGREAGIQLKVRVRGPAARHRHSPNA